MIVLKENMMYIISSIPGMKKQPVLKNYKNWITLDYIETRQCGDGET
jgi:hypothetical protein